MGMGGEEAKSDVVETGDDGDGDDDDDDGGGGTKKPPYSAVKRKAIE
jgi:hypothetical protein